MNKGSIQLGLAVGAALVVAGFLGGLWLARPALAPVGAWAGPQILQDVVFEGTVTLNGATTLGAETSFDATSCSSVSWNPGAITSSTVATTSLAMPSGYSAGDALLYGLAASTTAASDQAMLVLSVSRTDIASSTEVLVQLSSQSVDATSINPVTSTLSICYFDVP